MDGQAGSPEFVVINQADNWVMLNAYFISECSDTLGIPSASLRASGHWANEQSRIKLLTPDS
ncbi:hypothetical protein [Nostoc sp.]|uniref:hypothetical protein n=1 Tax=Nostoc sp. TaxID=1180 RepID=UPI002FFCDF7B